uniref:JmjC domain-containing protein n=1 Tax=Panagrolaimus sp. JU765 TaxID=591449 RepID=A0AC34RML9_9BILA
MKNYQKFCFETENEKIEWNFDEKKQFLKLKQLFLKFGRRFLIQTVAILVDVFNDEFEHFLMISTNEKYEKDLIFAGFLINDGIALFPNEKFEISGLETNDPELDGKIKKLLEFSRVLTKEFGRSFLEEFVAPSNFRRWSEERIFWRIAKVVADNLTFFNGNARFSSDCFDFGRKQVDPEKCQKLMVGMSAVYSKIQVHLNAKPFYQVLPVYKEAHAEICREIARFLARIGRLEESIKFIDDGIMKGAQSNDKSLSKLANFVCPKLEPCPTVEILQTPFPVPGPMRKTKQIMSKSRPSLEFFWQHCIRDSKPLVIKDLVNSFPIFDFFDFDYLNKIHGHRRAPIEFGSNQLDLLDAVVIPDYASMIESSSDPTINVFIGPSGTISPLHFDPKPNFFCQIRGRKFVRLVNPSFLSQVYMNPDPMYANSSVADLECPDYEQFPDLEGVESEDVVLEAGDCLFMPAKYLHLMRSLSPSISLSIWTG